MTLLSIRNLTKRFSVGSKSLTAVNRLSLDIQQGDTLGLVGESGCGKSTVGRCIMRLYEPDDGEVIFDGSDVLGLGQRELKRLRRQMQMVFQDPYASLNPRMTVQEIIGEGLDIHGLARGNAKRERVVDLLESVGLSSAHANRFPHEFSGGQRQRIGLARALAVEPRLLVCDEPISALDVSVQAQVVNLLQDLQERLQLTLLFIAHDLSVIEYISDRIAVMYLGHLVELAPSKELYRDPLHPYTQALLSAVPIPDPKQERTRAQILLPGDPPSPVNPPSGCPFHTRCPLAQDICRQTMPEWREVKPGHSVACHLV